MIREIGRKIPRSDTRAETTRRSSHLPDMAHMAQALEQLSSRQAHLQAAIQHKDEEHSRVLEVRGAVRRAMHCYYCILQSVIIFTFMTAYHLRLKLLFERRARKPLGLPQSNAPRVCAV